MWLDVLLRGIVTLLAYLADPRWHYRVLVIYQVGWLALVTLDWLTSLNLYILDDLLYLLDNDIIFVVCFVTGITNAGVMTYIFYHLSEEDTKLWRLLAVDNKRAMIEANPQLAGLLNWKNWKTWKGDIFDLLGLFRLGTFRGKHLAKVPANQGFLINAPVIRAQMFAASVFVNYFIIFFKVFGFAFTVIFRNFLYSKRFLHSTPTELIVRLIDTVFFFWHFFIVTELVELFLFYFLYQHTLLKHVNVFFLRGLKSKTRLMAICYLKAHKRILLFVLQFNSRLFCPICTYFFFSLFPSTAYATSRQFFELNPFMIPIFLAFLLLLLIVVYQITLFNKLFHHCVPHLPLVQHRLRGSIRLKWQLASYYEVLHSHHPIGYNIGMVGVIKKQNFLQLALVYMAFILFFVKFIKGLDQKQSFSETIVG